MVDVIYVENAAKAHVDLLETLVNDPSRVEGKVYFIGQDKPVKLWEFVNGLIDSAGGKKVSKKIPLWLGYFAGFLMEFIFKTFRVFKKEPLLTRFLVLQLAKSHYFSHKNAEKDFGYKAHVSSEEGFKKLKHYYS